jgi:hypothetical protein
MININDCAAVFLPAQDAGEVGFEFQPLKFDLFNPIVRSF